MKIPIPMMIMMMAMISRCHGEWNINHVIEEFDDYFDDSDTVKIAVLEVIIDYLEEEESICAKLTVKVLKGLRERHLNMGKVDLLEEAMNDVKEAAKNFDSISDESFECKEVLLTMISGSETGDSLGNPVLDAGLKFLSNANRENDACAQAGITLIKGLQSKNGALEALQRTISEYYQKSQRLEVKGSCLKAVQNMISNHGNDLSHLISQGEL